MTRSIRFALAAAVAAVAGSASAQLQFTSYVTGLSAPIFMAQDPTQPNVQFVLQQRGRVRAIVNGVLQATDALDLTAVVSNAGSEKGLLGMAFHPNYAQNRYVYFYFTTGNTSTSTTSWVRRYTRNALNPNIFDAGSAFNIFTLAQPFSNHNGGTIRFGTGGYLFIGLGDGGSANDPGNRAQNLTNLLGKFLRIDVNGDAYPADPNNNYAIPTGQPFTVTGGVLAPEIWSFGVRNPWKWSWDSTALLGTGGMLIGDVGQDVWEEIDFEPAGASARNYGWRPREGYASTGLSGGPNTNYKDPILVYDHTVGQSVTGGYVYRGTRLGDIFGRYFFADYVQSDLYSFPLVLDANGEGVNVPVGNVTDHGSDLGIGSSWFLGGIASIDTDANGELYVVDYGGGPSTNAGRILRIDPENRFYMTDFSTIQAAEVAGGLRHMIQQDQHAFYYEADFSAETLEGDGGVLRIGHQYAGTPPGSIVVRVRARTNLLTGQTLRVGFRNWSTGRVDFHATFNLTTTMATYNSGAISAAAYRRAADGRYELVLSSGLGNAPADPVSTFVDYVRLNP